MPENILGKAMEGIAKVGSKMVQPPISEAAGISAVGQNIKEYQGAVPPAPKTPQERVVTKSPVVDRIAPRAKYGDRPGEKRLKLENMPRIPAYQDGTHSVPETGPALIHKGEAVIPAAKTTGPTDIVLGGRQIRNPKGIVPKMDTDRPVRRVPEPVGARMDTSVPTMPENFDLSGMRSFKKGTPYVEKTQVAKLHKGEEVIPAKDNPMKKPMEQAYEMVAGKPKSKKAIKEHRIRKAKSGGHVIEHHHHNASEHPMEEHVVPDVAAMHKHLDDNPIEEAPEAQASGADAPGAALGM